MTPAPRRLRPLVALMLAAGCQAAAPSTEIAPHSAALTDPPAVGTFTALPANPVGGGANSMVLLTDGSVLVNSSGDWTQWTRLAPDSHGSYVNGTWTQAASGLNGRLYYPEFVLSDGRVFLGGGEYIQNNTVDNNQTELFDPVANTWTAGPPGLFGDIGDVSAVMLADGRVLLGHRFSSQTQIYDPATNAFTAAASMLSGDSGSEGGWQLLADGSVFASIRTVQRYLPGSNTWVADAPCPVTMSSDGEQGPVIMLQDGRVFASSDREFTAYFTPPATLNGTGSWTTGPSLPGGLFGDDTPGALLPNGNLLVEGTVGQFGNFSMFELDPNTNTYTSVTSPIGPTVGYVTRMLVLPNGQIMFTGGSGFFVYTPTGAPQDAWRPVVSSVTPNADGSFTVSGTQLNGRSYGASYGDDDMASSNYPIVSINDGNGNVFYARSYQFSTMGVRTGSATVSAHFRLPAGVPDGSYSLFVSAAGISSAAFPFTVGNGGGTTTTTLGPVADAHVRSGSFAATNFGTATGLEVKIPTNPTTSPDNTRRTFLKFDLTTVPGTVSAAKLRLFGSHPTNATNLSAFAVTGAWAENTITFNAQPALGAKQGASVSVGPTAAYYEWDVSSFVASQKAAGAGSVSLGITMDAGNDAGPAVFNSRENTANRPQLVVTSSSGGGNVAPTIATPAAATPNPVTGTTSALSVLGADDGGEAALVYTWSATGPAAVTFSANGTNAAKACTVTFGQAGSYTLQVVVKDTGGLTATSSVAVTVNQTLTAIAVAPASASVATGGTQQFTATAMDQFGAVISATPMITWAVSGGGTISGAGLFTAGAIAGGPFTVTASGDGKSGTAAVTVTGGTSTKTLTPTADAYVRDGSSASTNFGTDPTLVTKNSTAAGNNRRSFLKFDLTTITGTVTSAKLRLYGNHASGTTQDSAYAVASNSWTETGITWNNQPALGAKQSSVTVSTTAQYYELDVTAFVASQKAASINTVSLGVAMDTVTNNAPDTFNSRQATSNKPQLVVVSGP